MNAIVRKAKAGVTLVELLVVILIVTILSVSMLPLLQPFVVESQYAAEPIPVIGNLRTKIGLYHYDKGTLPCIELADTAGALTTPKIESWICTDSDGGTTAAADPSIADYFTRGYVNFSGSHSATAPTLTAYDPQTFTGKNKHFAALCDIDYQELKGKREKPHHFQYLVMYNGTDYAYFLGCFGDGNGLKLGTGYAVCEIVSPSTGHKYVGTWKRYKPVADEQVWFTSDTAKPNVGDDDKYTYGCYVPPKTDFPTLGNPTADGTMSVINDMIQFGWEF